MRLIVLTGLAGVGKTQMLDSLRCRGEATIDLEGFANHRGSAFGALGLGGQPSHQEFQRAVRQSIADHRGCTIWVEDEGEFVGSVGLPTELTSAMRRAPCIELDATRPERIERLVGEYGNAPLAEWFGAVDVVEPRLGGERAAAVRAALATADIERAVDILLDYYDRGYQRRASTMARNLLGRIEQGPSAIDDILSLASVSFA